MDLIGELVTNELIQRGGTLIDIGDYTINTEAAIKSMTQFKLVLSTQFNGVLVFQDEDDLTEFCQKVQVKRLEKLTGFKVLNLQKINKNKRVSCLENKNTLLLLTLPLLDDLWYIEIQWRVRQKNDRKGLLALWQPREVILLLKNPSQIEWLGKSISRKKKPCCASFSSLMGMIGFLETGKELHINDIKKFIK
jgi:hypothetical protein